MPGIDIWKDIIGYEGIYQISYCGEVRRIYKSGKINNIKPYPKTRSGKRLLVGLTLEGRKKEHMVHLLVAQAFLDKPKPDHVVYHKNGILRDNYASNLAWIDRKSLGKLTGAMSNKKSVAKIDSNGETIDIYSSARQAGRENYMSYQTIIDRCNGKVKSLYAPDGYVYIWEQ